MNLLKNNTSTKLTDRAATILANRIIKVQTLTSAWLNQRFNSFSTQRKKRLTVIVGLVGSILLIVGSLGSFYTIPKLSQNYTTIHIGMPSDLPRPPFTERQLTDSLTKKK